MDESHKHATGQKKPYLKEQILYYSIYTRLKYRQNESVVLQVSLPGCWWILLLDMGSGSWMCSLCDIYQPEEMYQGRGAMGVVCHSKDKYFITDIVQNGQYITLIKSRLAALLLFFNSLQTVNLPLVSEPAMNCSHHFLRTTIGQAVHLESVQLLNIRYISIKIFS